jgi:hypothetical protein
VEAVTLGFDVGTGGIDSGLATIYVATAAIAPPRTKLRIFKDLNIMNGHSLLDKTMQSKSNPKGSFALPQKWNCGFFFAWMW